MPQGASPGRTLNGATVSEIKGAPCTRRAHFHSRVHDFRSCAPGVCTIFEPFIIAIYWEGAWSNFRVHSLWEVHPVSAQNKSLISDTAQGASLGRTLLYHLTEM